MCRQPISPDRNMAGSLDLADPTTNATIAWQQYGVDGTGVGVAIVDSGVSLIVPDGSERRRALSLHTLGL